MPTSRPHGRCWTSATARSAKPSASTCLSAAAAERLATASGERYRDRALAEIATHAAQVERQRWLDAYNDAIALYNRGDLDGAREALQPIVDQSGHADLTSRARELLAAIERAQTE